MDSPLAILAATLAALVAGPMLASLPRVARSFSPVVEGFVLGSIGTLVLFFVLPESIESAGLMALAAATLGLAILTLTERALRLQPGRAHAIAIALGAVGLIVHTVVDGVALHDAHMGLGVALHRLPVGVAIWWLIKPRFGSAVAAGVLLLAGVATVGGFLVGGETLSALNGTGVAVFQAFVGGTLLHVIFHGGGGHHDHATGRFFGLSLLEVLGCVVGAGLVLGLSGHDEVSHLSGFATRFVHLALETAPAILLGTFLAGAIVVYLPKAGARWLGKGNAMSQAAKGTLFGVPLPICSCGVVPVYKGLVDKGVPATAGMAFLVATPELGIESLFLSVPLLGAEFTAVRLAAALVTALFVGLVVGRATKRKDDVEEAHEEDVPSGSKFKRALRYSLFEVTGDTAAWILAGVALAAAIPPGALEGFLGSLPPGADVFLAAIIGVPLYVCASGATPFAAALIAAGISPGAGLAFLLAGPATNITTFGVLARLHSRVIALGFASAVIAAAVTLGLVVNRVLPASIVQLPNSEHEASWLAWICLAAVALLYALTFLRQGPAHFLAPVLTFGDHHFHDDHAHEHGHDHGDHHGHKHEHHHNREDAHSHSGCCDHTH